MKKVIISAALGLMIPLMSMGQSMGPGTTGSSLSVAGLPHNFSSQTWNPIQAGTNNQMGGQICQPCHTPHNGNNSMIANAPLWNHAFTTASYNVYTGYEFATKGNVAGQPDGTSKLCLSCHDGSVALGSFGAQIGTTGTMATYNGGQASLDVDLSNDHPISFVYDSTKGGVYAPTHVYTGTKTVSGMLDAGGKMQCTSCHGPHANKTGYQLSISNQGSALCLACHKK